MNEWLEPKSFGSSTTSAGALALDRVMRTSSVCPSLRLPDDVLHMIVVVKRAQKFDRIGVVHHIEVDIPTIAIVDENVTMRSSASSNSHTRAAHT